MHACLIQVVCLIEVATKTCFTVSIIFLFCYYLAFGRLRATVVISGRKSLFLMIIVQ